MGNDHQYDLPLLANSDAIHVRHYLFDWTFNFDEHIVEGCSILILDPQNLVSAVDHQEPVSADDGSEKSIHIAVSSSSHGCENAAAEHRDGVCHAQGHCSCSVNLSDSPTSKMFIFILDACDLDISSIEALEVDDHLRTKIVDAEVLDDSSLYEAYLRLFNCTAAWTLDYLVEKWCIKITSKSHSREEFPRIVKIVYKTRPDTPSLWWTNDQDGR